MTDPACGLCNDRQKYPTGVVVRGCPVHDPDVADHEPRDSLLPYFGAEDEGWDE